MKNNKKFNRIFYTVCLISTPLVCTNYDVQQLTKLSGLPEQTVIQCLREFQEIEDWNESTAPYYGVFSQLINTHNLKKGCEVGIATGGHAYDILKKTTVETLYCVDPFAPELHEPLAARGILDLYFLRVKFRLSELGNRAQMIRKYSVPAAELFHDNELDFVFLDADHLYESVKQDIAVWYPKVRSGGIIGGDDYATKWPGVSQAVNEFFQARGLTINTDKNQPRIWWVQKP
jgi:predicted O-methyltransferase YrrM